MPCRGARGYSRCHIPSMPRVGMPSRRVPRRRGQRQQRGLRRGTWRSRALTTPSQTRLRGKPVAIAREVRQQNDAETAAPGTSMARTGSLLPVVVGGTVQSTDFRGKLTTNKLRLTKVMWLCARKDAVGSICLSDMMNGSSDVKICTLDSLIVRALRRTETST